MNTGVKGGEAEGGEPQRVIEHAEVIIVLGMHRSGTSAFAGALSLLGVDLGDDLMPGNFDNPKGYFEHNGIVAINESFLWERVSAWDDPRAPRTWSADLPSDKVENLLKKSFGNSRLWGLKDPRISILLPSYIPILKRLTTKIKAVLMLRSPTDVAASLSTRNQINYDRAAALWIDYTLAPLEYFSEADLTVVSYDELIDDPEELIRVAERLGLPSVSCDAALSRARTFLTKTLRHHLSHPNIQESALVTDKQRNMQLALDGYNALLEAVESGNSLIPTIDKIRDLANQLDRNSATNDYFDKKLPALYGTINALRQNQSETSHQEETIQLEFFTICASNYLAFASVLAKSLGLAYPGRKLTVFLIDDLVENVDISEYLTVLPAAEVLSDADWSHRLVYYDILEFSTSIKPACFLKMFELGHRNVVYLDPDIYVFRPLQQVANAFTHGAEVVLTPHILTPYPDDQKRPEDLDILRAGTFNLGFAAFANSDRARHLLHWWNDRLRFQCMSDVREGTFTDQKWIDFLPSFESSVYILRDPAYNVAYWNLHERYLVCSENLWGIAQSGQSIVPLVFYHYSGFDPKKPDILSKHQNRITAENSSVEVKDLIDFYKNHVISAGYETYMQIGISPLRFISGEIWDPICRSLYRESLRMGLNFEYPLKDPAFIVWMASYGPSDHVPRYLRELFKLRPDVGANFRDGHDRSNLIEWLRLNGKEQLGIDERLLVRLGLIGPPRNVIGVNYVGYLTAHLGIGEAARGMIEALTMAGIPVSILDISEMSNSPRGDYGIVSRFTSSETKLYPITILHVNADQLPYVMPKLPLGIQSTLKIGVWAWETSDFPEKWCDRFGLLDEVWVATRFMADAVSRKSTIPVFTVPYVFGWKSVECDREWLQSKLVDIGSDEFIFLFQFDAFSVPFRKNPHAVIRAFIEAFRPDVPVRLLIKTLNGVDNATLISELEALGSGRRVTIWDAPLSNNDRFKLLASVDCFVSLHRAEGFGMSIAEAMALKKPVLVTNWSGIADLLSTKVAALVDYTLKPLKQDYGPYEKGTLWAEVIIEDAAEKMRRIFEDTQYRNNIGKSAADFILNNLSPATVGALARERLERVVTSKMRNTATCEASAIPRTKASTLLRRLKILLRISSDVARRPLFYAKRIPSALRVLRKSGVRSVVAISLQLVDADRPRQ
ncbi:hypothetical protein ACOSOMT5_P0971 [Acidiphilium sp. MT5]